MARLTGQKLLKDPQTVEAARELIQAVQDTPAHPANNPNHELFDRSREQLRAAYVLLARQDPSWRPRRA